ncbi:MAG: oligopeptide/dipeptide ABC transporter ATP-binding protein, partial [Bryobacteraceae bacterium]
DVSVQATVLNLLADLRSQLGLSYLFISHDVSVVACLSDRVVVMFAGRICEEGRTSAVLLPPYHPYTETLLSAVPGVELAHARTPRVEASATQIWDGLGCPFHLRCPRKLGQVCEAVRPALTDDGNGHRIACHIPTADLVSLQVPVLDTRRISLKAIA